MKLYIVRHGETDWNLAHKAQGLADAHNWDIDDFNLALNTNEHNIEPIKSVFARSKKVLDRIKSENLEEAVVLVVANGTLLKPSIITSSATTKPPTSVPSASKTVPSPNTTSMCYN